MLFRNNHSLESAVSSGLDIVRVIIHDVEVRKVFADDLVADQFRVDLMVPLGYAKTILHDDHKEVANNLHRVHGDDVELILTSASRLTLPFASAITISMKMTAS